MASFFDFLPFKRKPRPGVQTREPLSSRHSMVLAKHEPTTVHADEPASLDVSQADVAIPFTSAELRRAQQMAMRLRQQHGAIGAKTRCQQLLQRADEPAEARFLQLVMRTIGGSG